MSHQHVRKHDSIGNIKLAFFLNFGFTLIEIVGSLLTNSLAILSDALHDLGDTLSLGLSWYLEKYSKREENKTFSYGYGRFSLLAALINSLILIAGSLYVLSQAIPRIIEPEHTHAPGMLLLAIGGIVVNGLAILRLKKGHSLNVQVVTWHLLEDVLGWMAVLIVSVVLLFKDIHFLDPILATLITLYVLYNMMAKLKKTLSLFLQGVPENVDLTAFEHELLAIDKVKSTHHTHIWSLDGEQHVLSTHLVVDGKTTKNETLRIKKKVRNLIKSLNVQHITIEVEYQNQDPECF